MSEAIDIEDVDPVWIYPAFAYILSCVSNSSIKNNLLLRGSLLTLALVDRAKFTRKPKDLDFVYYEKENTTENEDDSVPTVVSSPEYLERFDKMIQDFQVEIQEGSCEHFNQYTVTAVHKTWELTDFPGRKVIVKFYPEDYEDCFEIAVDFACGDPIIGTESVLDLVELIPPEIEYDVSLDCQVSVVSANMLAAWKIHSAMCEERWRPKDIYDLTFLLPEVKEPFLPYLKCAFSATNNLDEKLGNLINGEFCDGQDKEWEEAGFGGKESLAKAVEVIAFELSRLVPDTLWQKKI
ncbi:hypothetical protein HDV06_001702 [Boothiomyces sp. JEL0866]|nr:hypothetical protein HDV06_001702 [Boothiomyces sp. JEL0866]